MHGSRESVWQKAKSENQNDGGDQDHRSLELRLVPHRSLFKPVDNPQRAIHENEKRNENLREKHDFPQYDRRGEFIRFIAVAIDEALHHGGNSQNPQNHPDEDRNLRRSLEDPQDVPLLGMDHAVVAINGDDGQKGDAGCSVEKLQEELNFTHHLVFAALLKVIRLDGQTDQQQNVSQDQIEEEDVDGFRLPEFEFEDEDVNDRDVQQETQNELQADHRRVEDVQWPAFVNDVLAIHLGNVV